MEENINKLLKFRNFNEESIKEISSLALAFIGDGVFELIVRTYILNKNKKIKKLHLEAINFVSAKNQKDFALSILDKLTPEELQVFKRGKNAKSHTIPKNTSMEDYKLATAMEALIGYLYLLGRIDRIFELLNELEKFNEGK